MVLGTWENTFKIKSMVTALSYTQMAQDMKVRRAHKADACVVKLMCGVELVVVAELREGASSPPDQSVTQ